MSEEQDFKPVDLNTVKASTSRIDLSKATIPRSPSAGGAIRIGTNPKKATSRIDISAIPGATAKAATSPIGLGGSMGGENDDVFKRRTVLMDTANLPLSAAPSAQPRTVKIGGRPTVRVGGGASASTTFSPGRSSEDGDATPGKPTIKLKRPGGGVTVSSASTTFTAPSPIMIIDDDTPGAVWSVISIISMLVLAGLIYLQVMTFQGMAY